MSKRYDYLIVGAGVFGVTCAYLLKKAGKKVIIIDERNHIGGNCYTEEIEGINVHKYGAHIFHTSNEEVWKFVNQFSKFNNFVNSPLAYYHGKLYNLPFNMNTFHQLWPDVMTPSDAQEKIESVKTHFEKPKNLEEQALNLVGKEFYETLIKEYTEKQWGMTCDKLSPNIIKRVPLRFTYNNNYFNDRYQGIPIGGYTKMFEQMLKGIDVRLNIEFKDAMLEYEWNEIIYTGSIDRLCHYRFGHLDYRSVRFEHSIILTNDFQGVAVVNYTSHEKKFTRSIEHKHFENVQSDKTVVSLEYPYMTTAEDNPCYPINDEDNMLMYKRYEHYVKTSFPYVHLGGRLGLYKYLDMDKTIEEAMKLVRSLV